MGDAQVWNADLYDGKHSFVAAYGEDLIEWLAPKSGERILDLGSGTGHLAHQIADRGASVVGMDASPEMVAAAQAAYPDLTFVVGDATTFDLGVFDAIFSNATLHWVLDAPAAVDRMAQGLRSGGRLVAEFGGHGNVESVVRETRRAVEQVTGVVPPLPWYFPGVGEYASLLESAGFEVRQAVLFDRPTPLDGVAGLRNWLRMFGGRLLDGLSAEQIEAVLDDVEVALRPVLCHEGQWVADYRRLRIQAVRL